MMKREEYEEQEGKIIAEVMKEAKISFDSNENANEFINATRLSMRKMSLLISQGMEVTPAIKADEEIKLIAHEVKEKISAYQRYLIGVSDTKLIEKTDTTTKKASKKKNG